MAVSIGPKIGIDGEKEYRSELQNIIQQTKTLKSQMEACASSFDKDSKSIKKAKEQHKLLKDQQTALKKETEKLADAVKKSSEKYGENDTKTLKWKDALAKAETELNKVNSQLKDTSTAKAWADAIGAAGDKLKEFGDKIADVGKQLSLKVTTPIVGLGTASVKLSANFESSMSQVQATMGITKDAISQLDGASVNTMDSLEALAVSLGNSTKFSANEAADGINYLALAGYDVQKIYDTLPTVLDLAAAGNMELADTSNMLVSAMSALGETDPSHFADVLAKTASSSKTDVSQLGDALLQVGGTAKSLNGGLDEASAALGILANNGIEAAEGGTALRNIILAMTPTTKKAKEAWADLGVSAYDADGNMRPLQDTIKDLDEAMSGMSQQEKQSILTKMFNKTDLKSVQALMADCGDSWTDLSNKLSGSDGAASQMAATQLDNLNGQITLLKSALEGAAISIGEKLTPYVSQLVEWIQKAADWFNNLSDSQLNMIITIAGIVAAIGPVLTVIGTVVSGIGTVMGILSSLIPVAEALGVGVGALAGAISIVPIAIAALIAAGIALALNWDKVKAKAVEVASGFKSAWNDAMTGISGYINGIRDKVSAGMEAVKAKVTTQATAAYTAISSKFNAMKTVVSNVMDTIRNAVSNAISRLKSILNTTLTFPHIKVPHFKISGGVIPWGIGGMGTKPTVSVEWYKKAYDNAVFFNSPTILSTMNGLKGFGDGNGAEIVTGESHLMTDIYSVVSGVVGENMNGIYRLLETYLPGCANAQIYLDGNALVGATAPRMNAELGRLAYMRR